MELIGERDCVLYVIVMIFGMSFIVCLMSFFQEARQQFIKPCEVNKIM